jgi:transposase
MAVYVGEQDIAAKESSRALDIATKESLVALDVKTYDLLEGSFLVIANFLKKTRLKEAVDGMIPKTRQHKTTHGEVIEFLLLSAFTVHRRALYTLNDIFNDTLFCLYFGSNHRKEDFNDDVLAKTLEAIHNYGVERFFFGIICHLHQYYPEHLSLKRFHVDTTSINVYGEYSSCSNSDYDKELPRIVHGHSKSGQNHLKQLKIGLVTNCKGVPLLIKPLSGNSSDTNDLRELGLDFVKMFLNSIFKDHDPIYIADSAFFSEKNIRQWSLSFITRAPETVGEVKTIVRKELDMNLMEEDQRYNYFLTQFEYGGVPLQMLVLHSPDMAKKQEKSLNRKLCDLLLSANKDLKKITRLTFACKTDAKRAILAFLKKQKNACFISCVYEEVKVPTEAKVGRPSKGIEYKTNFRIKATIRLRKRIAEEERRALGRFVLVTNDLSLSPINILQYYKDQSKVEKNFKFAKNNELRISEVLLKNPKRISGLSCFIGMVLLVAALLELELRENFKNNNYAITDMAGKITQKPTLRLAFHHLKSVKFVVRVNEHSDLVFCNLELPLSNNEQRILLAFGESSIPFYQNHTGFMSIKEADFILCNITRWREFRNSRVEL